MFSYFVKEELVADRFNRKVKFKWFLFALLFFLQISESTYAQKKPPKKTGSGKQLPQLQLGLKTGINFTKVQSLLPFSALENTSEDPEFNHKKYKKGRPGSQLGFTAAFGLNNTFTFSISPVYINYNFEYEDAHSWEDLEVTENNTKLDFTHKHNLQYIEVPLTVKYHFLPGKIKPYLEAGAYFGVLQQATKNIRTTRIDNATSENEIKVSDEQTIGAKSLFIRSHAGAIAGAGIRYDVGRVSSLMEGSTNLGVVTIFLSGVYKYGFNNITDVKNRYADNRSFFATYDVMDDLKIRNIEVSLGCLFTLKYKISK